MWPCTARSTKGRIDKAVDIVVAPVGPTRARITIVPAPTLLAGVDVGVAAAVATVVTVALLLDGVKPLPQVTPRVTLLDIKDIQPPNIEAYVGVGGVVVNQPQEGVPYGCPEIFELAVFRTCSEHRL